MKVHFLADNDDVFVCGDKPKKNLKGLDYINTWDPLWPVPVSCLDCLIKRPKNWKRSKTHGFKKI